MRISLRYQISQAQADKFLSLCAFQKQQVAANGSCYQKVRNTFRILAKGNFFTVVHLASTHKVEQRYNINFVCVISTWWGLSVEETARETCKSLHLYRSKHQTWNKNFQTQQNKLLCFFGHFFAGLRSSMTWIQAVKDKEKRWKTDFLITAANILP